MRSRSEHTEHNDDTSLHSGVIEHDWAGCDPALHFACAVVPRRLALVVQSCSHPTLQLQSGNVFCKTPFPVTVRGGSARTPPYRESRPIHTSLLASAMPFAHGNALGARARHGRGRLLALTLCCAALAVQLSKACSHCIQNHVRGSLAVAPSPVLTKWVPYCKISLRGSL